MRKVILLLVVTLLVNTKAYCTTDTSFTATVAKAEVVSKKTIKLTLLNENKDSVYLFTRFVEEYPTGTKLRVSFYKTRPRKLIIASKEAISAKIETL